MSRAGQRDDYHMKIMAHSKILHFLNKKIYLFSMSSQTNNLEVGKIY